MGFAEKFNRYYTDANWQPARTVYVTPNGNGDGTTRDRPASVSQALAEAAPGDKIVFTRSTSPYSGCFEVSDGGTYDAPIVLFAERNTDGSRGVEMNCCTSGRASCFNLEGSDYVAVDGFKLNGGSYGVRAVGDDFTASGHQKGIAVLNVDAGHQSKDPIFSGQSDWMVVEGNVAHHAGSGDGHGVYLSNGSDWLVARFNETFSNVNADFQINADPIYTCTDEGVSETDPECDGPAAQGQGRGASEFVLFEGNYLHNDRIGPNFTSVRNSVMKNNVIGFFERHGTSFWQETTNPKLGSHHNVVEHNLFVGTNSQHVVQFIEHSGNNVFKNNVVVGVNASGTAASTSPVLLEIGSTATGMDFANNYYVSGQFDGHTLASDETRGTSFDARWWGNFKTDGSGAIDGFKPAAGAPFLDRAQKLAEVPTDRNGTPRNNPADLGPFELP
jgi:hypothetical protein